MDYDNGLVFMDLIILQCYFLGQFDLQGFYLCIVVDVMNNEVIVLMDIIIMVRILLQVLLEFLLNIFWCFVDVEYVFFNFEDFWQEIFLEDCFLVEFIKDSL